MLLISLNRISKPSSIVLLSILSVFIDFSDARIICTEQTNYSQTLNKMVLKIIEHFDRNCLIHILIQEEKNIPCQFDLSIGDIFGRWELVITQPQTGMQVADILKRNPDVFIIFMCDSLTLVQLEKAIFEINLYKKSWNVNAKFLIVTTNLSHNKLIIDTLNFMWLRNAFKTALLFVNSTQLSGSVYSSIPFSENFSTCREVTSISQVQELNLTSDNFSPKYIIGYAFSTPISFLGCPVLAHTYPFPPYSVEEHFMNQSVYKLGTEVQLVQLVAKTYNFSVTISNTPGYGQLYGWRTQLPNGTTVGMFEDLERLKIDLAFAGAIPSSGNYYKFESVSSYAFSSLSWYVSNPDLTPNWVYVLHTFTGVTWLSLVLVFGLVSILYLFSNNVLPATRKEPVDLNMVGFSLGFTLRWTKVVHLRVLLFTWSLFCLHITQMFNTKLFSILAQRPESAGIKSIEDLYESGLRTCISTFYRDFYYKQTDGMIRNFLKHYIDCSNMSESVDKFLTDRNFSILAKDDNLEFLIDTEREGVHRMKEQFISFPVSIYLSKGNILKEPLRNIIFKTTEYGFVRKWRRDIKKKVKIKYKSKGINSQNENKVLLSNSDFIWVYFLFVTGQFFSFVVFLFEIYYDKFISNLV